MSLPAENADAIIAAHIGADAATVLVDYLRESGAEFTAERTALELESMAPRVNRASFRRVRELGANAEELLRNASRPWVTVFRNGIIRTLHPDIGELPSSVFAITFAMTPADMYRYIASINGLSDEDAGVLAYMAMRFWTPYDPNEKPGWPFNQPGYTWEDERDAQAQAGRFLADSYKVETSRLVDNVIHKFKIVDERVIRPEVTAIGDNMADILLETVEVDIASGYTVKMSFGHSEPDGGYDKREFAGDQPGAAELFLTERTINLGVRFFAIPDLLQNAEIITIKNGLTAREVVMKNPTTGVKRRIDPGVVLTITGHDLSNDWEMSVEDEEAN